MNSDIYFFSSPETIFSEISDSSIAIIEHRLPKIFSHLREMGQFCVEWVTIKNDKEGLRCLNHWKRECINWCYEKKNKQEWAIKNIWMIGQKGDKFARNSKQWCWNCSMELFDV